MKKRRKQKKKNKGLYMKIVLTGMFVFLLLFTITCLYISFCTSFEPSTLIISVFAYCGAEGGLLAWIKNTKMSSNKESSVSNNVVDEQRFGDDGLLG